MNRSASSSLRTRTRPPRRKALFARRPSFAAAGGVALMGLILTSACTSASGATEAPAAPAEASSSDQEAANVAAGAFVHARPLDEVSALWGPAEAVAPPQGKTTLSAPLAGRVLSVRVQAGDMVQSGAVIAEVVMPALAEHAARRQRSLAQLKTLRPRLEQLQALMRSGVAKTSDLVSVQLATADAQAEQQLAEALLRSAGFSPERSASWVDNGGATVLRAPRAGIVTHVAVSPGAAFDQHQALAHMAHDTATRVQARLPPNLLDHDGAGFVFVPSGRGALAPVPLTLLTRLPGVDPHEGTQQAWFTPPEAVPLPPGTRGWVHLKLEGAAQVIPEAAVLQTQIDGGKATASVRVRTGAEVVARDVTVAAVVSGLAIVSGLPADAVVQVDADAARRAPRASGEQP